MTNAPDHGPKYEVERSALRRNVAKALRRAQRLPAPSSLTDVEIEDLGLSEVSCVSNHSFCNIHQSKLAYIMSE